jgi:hypothetical protein
MPRAQDLLPPGRQTRIWSRVAGDLLDLAALGAGLRETERKERTLL